MLKLRESPLRCTFFSPAKFFRLKLLFSLPPSLVLWIFFAREKKGNSFSPLHFFPCNVVLLRCWSASAVASKLEKWRGSGRRGAVSIGMGSEHGLAVKELSRSVVLGAFCVR